MPSYEEIPLPEKRVKMLRDVAHVPLARPRAPYPISSLILTLVARRRIGRKPGTQEICPQELCGSGGCLNEEKVRRGG
ncbi:uncharacterized [Tachysurus ichikawai]